MSTWSQPVSASVAHRRAGGRRRYNKARRYTQKERRVRVVELMREAPCHITLDHATRLMVAREFRVTISTINRDVAALRQTADLPRPCCVPHGELQEAAAARGEALAAALERSRVTSLGRFLSPEAITRVLADRQCGRHKRA